MQNKGFVITFSILLTLVCLFYLSFTFVTRSYDKKAEEYATSFALANAKGDQLLQDELYNKQYTHYLDSMSTEKVWMTFSWLGAKDLGYTLKDCREKEIGLGLDLKGGMSVIVEVDASAVLRSLGDPDNEAFNAALKEASDENRKGSNRDYITIFVEKFRNANGNDKLAGVFSTKMRDQFGATDKDDKVVAALRAELQSVADNSFNVLRTRIDRFGVVAPNIQKLDNRAERIMIELPGIKEPERVRKLLQGSANLEFWKTYNIGEIQGYLNVLNERSREALLSQTTVDSTSVASDSLQSTDVKSLGFTKPFMENFIHGGMGAVVGVVNKNDTAAVNAILYKYRDTYPTDLNFAWGFKAEDVRETQITLYALRGDGIKKGPALDGEVVISAKADQSQRSAAWEVDMQMNSLGTQRWAAITGAEKGRSIAIVLDGSVYSAPNVNDRIEGGRSQITGNFTPEDAKDLENVLKSGKMKAGVHIVQEDIVGPSLGQEAIQAGIISFLLALVLLMTYICLVYGFIPGLIANVAVLVNLFFTVGILAAFGAVMTLPGITGLVLALALAVDANVLVYERTKEELRAGKNVKVAIVDGYKHAFSAIFDGHASQVITAIILAYFGTGPIQGFATTLIIGIIASFITNVFLTRIFYEYMLDKGHLRTLTFTTAISRKLFVDTKINFLGMTKKIVIFSTVLILAGVASLFINGLNGGIDFTGGRNYLVRFDKNVNADAVEKALMPEFQGSTVLVLTSGSASQSSTTSQVRITTNYKIEEATDEVEAEIRTKMTKALAAEGFIENGKTIDNYVQSSQRVGPSVADDLKTAATIAVLIAVVCMALYILLRFRDIAFSVGTFIAVAHDAVMVIILYSLLYKIMPFSMEIDQSFIAAVLTVVGYSINDKVVIFDRIREIRNMYPKRNITDTINEALNSTLGRTINTSLSTLIVILCIFILGGDTIRSFTFAIFIGIIIGTYSSVFVATPIAWTIFKKEHAKKAVEAK
ncbi:protein translocase subunit SecDF [Dysgonomonas sp. Marseille-P4677]|uniref:protein translocase subunit SecDF n=1 Tax=Dysgonomonas sp. Marseille-P4677 TaxID=2364790 RepID=UPI00191486C7|nr:protein translocase subunit SecDF [Dysgonomonas sp. Marseille-P4677]MBK5722949.1 protein translocase subunit SecDF [Dysgonomonas sp. Marseille-P4677]